MSPNLDPAQRILGTFTILPCLFDLPPAGPLPRIETLSELAGTGKESFPSNPFKQRMATAEASLTVSADH
jgi:hypothetical protein